MAGPSIAADSRFELSAPPGWMRREAGDGQRFTFTRDGSSLQRISAGAAAVGAPLGFGGERRVVTSAMSVDELRVLIEDEIGSAPSVSEVEVVERTPATLSGKPGIRVLAAFRDGAGLRRRIAIYGAFSGERAYFVWYAAPERHYFALDLAAFEHVARSFRIRE